MGDSKAYVLVTCNVPVRALDSCSTDDLKRNFTVRVNNNVVEPINIFVNHPSFPQHSGKILLELRREDVPTKGQSIHVSYDQRSSCHIVHRDLADSVTSKLGSFSHNSENSSVIKNVQPDQLPKVVKVDVPNEFGGKVITVNLTNFRNIDSSENFDNFEITVSPSMGDNYNNVVFSGSGSLTDSTIHFTAVEGAIQKGMSYDISYNGTNVIDHFGLELQPFTSSPVLCQNSIQGLVFHSGSIETTSPNTITLRFKNPITGHRVGLEGNLDTLYQNINSGYRIHKRQSDNQFSVYNAASVKSLIVPPDNKRVLQMTSPFVFKETDSIGVEWNPTRVNPDFRIKDEFGNEILSSSFDPSVLEYEESINVVNNINGITLDSINSTITTTSSRIELNLSFKRTKTDESVVVTLENATPRDFSIRNRTTNRVFNPDSIVDNNNGTFKISPK